MGGGVKNIAGGGGGGGYCHFCTANVRTVYEVILCTQRYVRICMRLESVNTHEYLHLCVLRWIF